METRSSAISIWPHFVELVRICPGTFPIIRSVCDAYLSPELIVRSVVSELQLIGIQVFSSGSFDCDLHYQLAVSSSETSMPLRS